MPLYLIVSTRNFLSLRVFLNFLNKTLYKNSLVSLNITQFHNYSTRKTTVTVLKSPHVNKKAKESFCFFSCTKTFVLLSRNIKKDVLYLKMLNKMIFFDIKIKLKYKNLEHNVKKDCSINPNLFVKNKSSVVLFDLFGEKCYTRKLLV